MPESALPTLADLLDSPERAFDVAPGEARRLLVKLAAVAEGLRVAASGVQQDGSGHATDPGDRLLTVAQVAQRTGYTRKRVYARARGWTFTRQDGKGCTLRFSERGLEAWMAGKSGLSMRRSNANVSPGGHGAHREGT